jgi:hypothetical protein
VPEVVLRVLHVVRGLDVQREDVVVGVQGQHDALEHALAGFCGCLGHVRVPRVDGGFRGDSR